MAMGIMTACDESRAPNSSVELITLDAPTNLTADFWDLTWDSVENASGYEIKARWEKSGADEDIWVVEEGRTSETCFDLYPYCLPEELYYIEIKAKGDGKTYEDSEWAFVEYEAEQVTSGLIYTPISDDADFEGYYVRKINCNDEEEIVFPDTYEGKPVLAIKEDYYMTMAGIGKTDDDYRNEKIVRVRLPFGLEEIGFRAFTFCLKLEKIKLPDGLTSLLWNAFYNCDALKEVEIPKTVTEISSEAFGDCRNLQTISAADGMDFSKLNLDKEAFKKTAWLNEQEEDFVVWQNMLYLYQGNAAELTAADFPKAEYLSANLFHGNEKLTSVALPDGYKKISSNCFSGCVNLTKVSLPESVKYLNDGAFYECKNLTEINFPKQLKEIGRMAFHQCEKLTSVDLPNTVTSVGMSSFAGCIALEYVSIPSGVTVLEVGTFQNCKSLKTVILANGLEKMENAMSGVFQGCESLTEINIPETVTKIGERSFADTAIKEIVIPKSVLEIYNTTFGGGFWGKCVLERLYYCGNSGFEDILTGGELPESITVYHYSESEPAKKEDGTYNGNYWRYVNGKPTAWE